MLLGREIQSPNGAVARFHGDKRQGLEDGKQDAMNALAACCRLRQKAQQGLSQVTGRFRLHRAAPGNGSSRDLKSGTAGPRSGPSLATNFNQNGLEQAATLYHPASNSLQYEQGGRHCPRQISLMLLVIPTPRLCCRRIFSAGWQPSFDSHPARPRRSN